MIPPFSAPGVRLSVAARTDRGKRRAVNEDALLAVDPCFVVADGMGGHEMGDVAAQAAISAFSDRFTTPVDATMHSIEAALREAKERVRTVAETTERGAGCTLSNVIRFEHEGQPHWYVLNVGDSRVYLQRGNQLRQLTTDHSLRSELVADGNDLGSATPRNIITRALGSDDDRHDAWLLPIEAGSRVLICSDGLTSELEDRQIEAVLVARGRADSVAEELLRQSLDAGGRDNISIIVVDVLVDGTARPTPFDAQDELDDLTLDVTRPKKARLHMQAMRAL